MEVTAGARQQWWLGGTSRAGLRSKKPKGLSQNATVSAGITGQSSGRVMWWMPKTYHKTMSVYLLHLAKHTEGAVAGGA